MPNTSTVPAKHVPEHPWNVVQRIAFRFVFVYFGLYLIPSLLGAVPFLSVMLAALLALFIYVEALDRVSMYREFAAPNAPRPVLYGIWDVETLARNGVEQPPTLTDSMRLRRVVFDMFDRAVFRSMSDSAERFAFAVDTTKRLITFTSRAKVAAVEALSFEKPDADHLLLSGLLRGDSVSIRLTRFDENRYRLLGREFHWIRE